MIFRERAMQFALHEDSIVHRDHADLEERPVVPDIYFLKSSCRIAARAPDLHEDDLFNIANNFALRHHNLRQKDNYDDACLTWMFYVYLATTHLILGRVGGVDGFAAPADLIFVGGTRGCPPTGWQRRCALSTVSRRVVGAREERLCGICKRSAVGDNFVVPILAGADSDGDLSAQDHAGEVASELGDARGRDDAVLIPCCCLHPILVIPACGLNAFLRVHGERAKPTLRLLPKRR